MSDIEKKLADYRAKKKKISEDSPQPSNYTRNLLQFLSRSNRDKSEEMEDLKEKLIEESKEDDIQITENDSEVDDSLNCCSYMDIVYYSFCFMLWATIWAIFIKLQFGTVYLVLSALIGIYFNTRTRPKKRGEISAYSVFNKDCESIDGTLKAEQFEREIRYGPVSVH